PGKGNAFFFSLRIIGTSGSLIISTPYQKLCGRVFGQVMEESLFVQPDTETIFHYHYFMFCDRFKMQPWMHNYLPPICPPAPLRYEAGSLSLFPPAPASL